MFGIELFSLPPRVWLEAAFSLAVSICEAGVFLVDLYSEPHPLVSRLSAGFLSRCPPCGGSCLCLSVPAPPTAVKAETSRGQSQPLPSGWKPVSEPPSSSTFLLSLDVCSLWMPFFITGSVMHRQWLLKTLSSMFSHFRGKVAWSNLAAILPETEETLSNFYPSRFSAGFQGSRGEAAKWRHLSEQGTLFRELTFKLTFLVTIIGNVSETEIDNILWRSWLFEECGSFKFLQNCKYLCEPEGQMKVEAVILSWCWFRCWQLSAYHRDEKSLNFAEAYNENLKSHLIEDSHITHPK